MQFYFMWFSVYFILGQNIVIGPSDFEWLFLNSSLGIYARLFWETIIQSIGFMVFTFFCSNATVHVMQFSIFCFSLQFRSCFFFCLHLRFRFIYVSASFTFLLLVSFTFSVWIYGRLNILVLFPFEDEAQLSLRFRL